MQQMRCKRELSINNLIIYIKNREHKIRINKQQLHSSSLDRNLPLILVLILLNYGFQMHEEVILHDFVDNYEIYVY